MLRNKHDSSGNHPIIRPNHPTGGSENRGKHDSSIQLGRMASIAGPYPANPTGLNTLRLSILAGFMGAYGCIYGCEGQMFETADIPITPEVLTLIAEIDEFKGAWRALGTLAPERLSALRSVATIESIGSSTRIEGSKLSDRDVERLLANLEIKTFATRDEQEVAGYAEVMETTFHAWPEIPVTENHIKQLHRDLLRYSEKDDRHRGEYKTLPNSVAAFDNAGQQIAVVFETASPFDTPRLMAELVAWLREAQELKRLSSLV